MPDNSIMNIAIAGIIVLVAAWYVVPSWTGRLLVALERWRNGVHSQTIEINGATWHFLDAGHGVPLLALHGIAADADHWVRFSGKMRSKARIIAPDLPGFGESSAPTNSDYSLDEQVTRLHGFVTAIGLEQFILAGNSLGGLLAAAYAKRYPRQVIGLCLLAPGGVIGAQLSPVLKTIEQNGPNPFVISSATKFDQLLSACFYKRPWLPWPVKKLVRDRTISLHANTSAVFEEIRINANRLETIAPELNLPCLVLWGRNDQVLDVSGAEILMQILPAAKLVILEKTGHLPMLERPAICASLIQQFIDDL